VTRPPVFIGGSGRSGTTLLSTILDSHPNIACGLELKVTPRVARLWYELQTTYKQNLSRFCLATEDIDRIFAQMILALMEKYLRESGKQRMAEKTPGNVFVFQFLHRLFPQSPLVHVIRDGRDVVCSLLSMRWVDPQTRRPLPYTRDAGKAAEYWASSVRAGRRLLESRSARQRYVEVRYEQLVAEPVSTLQRLLAFMDEPWHPSVLDFHRQKHGLRLGHPASGRLYTRAVGRWRRDLRPPDRAAVKEAAGDLLIELGYAADGDW